MHAFKRHLLALGLATVMLGGLPSCQSPAVMSEEANPNDSMQLGNFSVSLAVKDIHASKAFYEKLDFKEVGGVIEQNWVVLQNGTVTVGLFQGMFEDNLMTFNPGWDHKRETPDGFQDVRELQALLKARGITMVMEADESGTGPASFVITDPDGNTLLFDQHVESPK